VDGHLVDLGVTEDTLNGIHGGTEQVLAEFLETSTGDGGVEINTLVERIDFNGSLSGRREGTLGTLASSAETTKSTSVGSEILLVLALELLGEVVDETVIEILTSQVSVTSSGLDLEDTILNGEEGDIESSSSKIEDENIALTRSLLVETVGDSSGSWLVDDTEDVETSDETGILGSLTLRVVEVGWYSNDGIADSSSKVRLGSLSHLGENHRRDFLRCEGLGLTLELNLDDWLSSLVDDLEWEMLHVGLDLSIVKLATDQTLSVEDGVVSV
jgi:hypothetical protein